MLTHWNLAWTSAQIGAASCEIQFLKLVTDVRWEVLCETAFKTCLRNARQCFSQVSFFSFTKLNCKQSSKQLRRAQISRPNRTTGKCESPTTGNMWCTIYLRTDATERLTSSKLQLRVLFVLRVILFVGKWREQKKRWSSFKKKKGLTKASVGVIQHVNMKSVQHQKGNLDGVYSGVQFLLRLQPSPSIRHRQERRVFMCSFNAAGHYIHHRSCAPCACRALSVRRLDLNQTGNWGVPSRGQPQDTAGKRKSNCSTSASRAWCHMSNDLWSLEFQQYTES